nr:Plug domain-containing protein [Dokdonella sp.]
MYAARGSNSTVTAYIRGVGQADPLWGVDPGVGIYLDDVYIARPQGALLDVFDVERIEVLRGPRRHAVRQEHHRRRHQVCVGAAGRGFLRPGLGDRRQLQPGRR